MKPRKIIKQRKSFFILKEQIKQLKVRNKQYLISYKVKISEFRLSSPHESLFLSVWRKLFSFNLTRLIPKTSFLMASSTSLEAISRRLSSVHKNPSVLPSTSKEMIESSGMTNGLMFKLCGETGVITKLAASGKTTGPLQLNEYPVEPVGVATIKPSAQ